MFLSKRIIVIIISLSVVAFIGLLAIQVIWIQRSVALNRQQFESKMTVVTKHIQESFMSVQPTFGNDVVVMNSQEDLFKDNPGMKPLEEMIRQNVDAVFKKDKIPLAYTLTARMDTACYVHCHEMRSVRSDLSKSDYLVCLCNYLPDTRYHAIDVGFSISGLNDYLIKDTSGLVIPSMVLLILLIALFSYIIVIINKQKSLAELKNDFINNLTHEFKTPLFSIRLTSKLLSKSPAIAESEKLKSYVDLIGTENLRLQAQVDKILQMAAIESGNLIMEKKAVDAHQVVQKNISAFRAAIEEKGGAISFHPGATKFTCIADEVHFSNVISNLIDNAYKYSNNPMIITITTSNTDGHLIIEVKDNGIGMDETSQRMIFDKFYRVKKGNVHDVKGFGLGLSYVKKIVGMHGGTIHVDSKPGAGTIFRIQLPLE